MTTRRPTDLILPPSTRMIWSLAAVPFAGSTRFPARIAIVCATSGGQQTNHSARNLRRITGPPKIPTTRPLERIPHAQLDQALFSLQRVAGERGGLSEIVTQLVALIACRIDVVENVVHLEDRFDPAELARHGEKLRNAQVGLEEVGADAGIDGRNSYGQVVVDAVAV